MTWLKLLGFLGRNWLHIAIAAGLAFAVWKIDQNGYERAERHAAEREARIVEEVRQMEKRIAEQISEIDSDLAAQTSTIDATERTIIVPTLTKEIARDPRFSDPAAGITDSVRNELNRARALSASPTVLDSSAMPSGGNAD